MNPCSTLLFPRPCLLLLTDAGRTAAGAGFNPASDNVLLTPFRSAFLVLFGGTLLVLTLRRLRSYKLQERYALVFGLLALPFIGLAFWPDGLGWLASKLNIQYNTLALIGVSSFLLLAVFELLSIVSQQDQKITALAQLVGILMEREKLVEKEHRPGAEVGQIMNAE